MTFYALLTVDNAQSHVTAFRPISEAASSWSDDNYRYQLSTLSFDFCLTVALLAFFSRITPASRFGLVTQGFHRLNALPVAQPTVLQH